MTKSLLSFAAFSCCSVLSAVSVERPNIVFCIADDASPHFGVYGHDWVNTPNIDRVAKAGLIFENAYTPTAKCAPSRACILTGRNPWLLEEAGNHQAYFPYKYKAFSEALNDRGVKVGAYGKVWGPGKASHADGGERDFALTPIKASSPGEAFQTLLSERKPGQPYFFWFGSKNPHRPYKLDAGLEAGKKPSDIPRVPKMWPDNDTVRRDMLDYATEVEAFDAEVGQVLSVLETTGEIDNTLVIITSDHGMPFPRVKGHNYDEANHIPFVARWPAGIKNPGRRVKDFLSFSDLAPSFLSIMGVATEAAGLQPFTGVPFTDLLAGAPVHPRDHIILGRERTDVYARPGSPTGLGYPIRVLREGSFYYIHNFKPDRWPCGNPELSLKDTDDSPTKRFINDSGMEDRFWQFCYGFRPEEELYDLSADPDCVVNLAKDPNHQSRMAAMKDKLFTLLRDQKDPRLLGQGDLFDNYPCTKPAGAVKKKKKE
jgi:arylsulfatase A-like enzyme